MPKTKGRVPSTTRGFGGRLPPIHTRASGPPVPKCTASSRISSFPWVRTTAPTEPRPPQYGSWSRILGLHRSQFWESTPTDAQSTGAGWPAQGGVRSLRYATASVPLSSSCSRSVLTGTASESIESRRSIDRFGVEWTYAAGCRRHPHPCLGCVCSSLSLCAQQRSTHEAQAAAVADETAKPRREAHGPRMSKPVPILLDIELEPPPQSRCQASKPRPDRSRRQWRGNVVLPSASIGLGWSVAVWARLQRPQRTRREAAWG